MPADDPRRDVELYLSHLLRHKMSAGNHPSLLFPHHPPAAHTWSPSIDMYETADAVVVLLELAGVNPDKTEVHAEPQLLVVRGVRRQRPAPATGTRSYQALEIPYGAFERVLQLPAGLDTAATQASYRDGLLEISVPKRRPHQVRITLDDAPAGNTSTPGR